MDTTIGWEDSEDLDLEEEGDIEDLEEEEENLIYRQKL